MVRLLVIGAGQRGSLLSRYALLEPGRMQVVGVAEPRAAWRQRLAADHAVPPARVFEDWRPALAVPRFADAVLIATPDRQHAEPALAALRTGHHLLLEKPMATTEADCRAIVDAAEQAGTVLTVAHVLRYTARTRAIQAAVAAGRIGRIVDIQRTERIGWWHFAHSYVRGNWRREDEACPLVLAKSCHDLDWMLALAGQPCERVASFAHRSHFRVEDKPAEAGEATRCLDCAIEPDCPYSAVRIYLERAREGETGWPVEVVGTDTSPTAVEAALRDGPYGRCVYTCDNDVPDHQVVAMQLVGGATATLTITAFSEMRGRTTRISGTHGCIVADDSGLWLTDFRTGQRHPLSVDAAPVRLGGHEGGDQGVVEAFLDAVEHGRPAPTDARDSLASHLLAFAAERSRHDGRVVELEPTGD